MKSSLAFAVLLSLVSATSAFAESATPIDFEMETIVNCKAAQEGLRFSEGLVIRHARLGGYTDAVFSRFVLGRTNTTEISNVQQSESSPDEVFTAPVRGGEFRLTVELSRTETHEGQDWAPATLELGAQKYDLFCQHYMMAL